MLASGGVYRPGLLGDSGDSVVSDLILAEVRQDLAPREARGSDMVPTWPLEAASPIHADSHEQYW